MNLDRLRFKLVHAVTAYDRRQSQRRDYNPYALPQYLGRVHDIVADIKHGAPVRDAILAGFSGRLRDACLRAVEEPLSPTTEQHPQPLCYTPVVTVASSRPELQRGSIPQPSPRSFSEPQRGSISQPRVASPRATLGAPSLPTQP